MHTILTVSEAPRELGRLKNGFELLRLKVKSRRHAVTLTGSESIPRKISHKFVNFLSQARGKCLGFIG